MAVISSTLLNDSETDGLNNSKTWGQVQAWQRRLDEHQGHPGKSVDAMRDRLRKYTAELQLELKGILEARGVNTSAGVIEMVLNPDGSIVLNIVVPD